MFFTFDILLPLDIKVFRSRTGESLKLDLILVNSALNTYVVSIKRILCDPYYKTPNNAPVSSKDFLGIQAAIESGFIQNMYVT